MKAIILSTVLLGSVAFANESAAPAQAAPAAAAAKMTKKDAKMACKAEGKKGKEMRSCMKEKLGH
jgi:hypothetical protein